MNDSIEVVITDIDGVLTDGKLMLDKGAEINKCLCFKDLDAVSSFRTNGIKFGIISGESDQFTELVRGRMSPDYFFAGCKDKRKALEEIASREGLTLSHFCYIGDGKYDIEAIQSAGIGVCPRDAIEEVKRASDVVLHRKGGEGCLSEVFSLLCNENTANGSKPGTSLVLHDLIAHNEVVESILGNGELQEIICSIAEEIIRSLKTGGQLLLCGNGGSAADSQHLATELVSRFYHERMALNAEALTVNTSSLTAIGNDYSYNRVFARQVEAKGKSGDVLIGISTSGESESIIEAVKTARQKNMKTIAFTGNRESTLKKLADITVSVPSKDTPRIQEMHILIGHIICELVEEAFVKE